MRVAHRALLIFVLNIVSRPRTALLVSLLLAIACAALAYTRLNISAFSCGCANGFDDTSLSHMDCAAGGTFSSPRTTRHASTSAVVATVSA